MESAWLYHHLGTLAQIAGFSALILIGIMSLYRKRKSKKLSRKSGNGASKKVQ
ncbi:MAG: hypothetical protein JXX14_24490 [Deltaproteobacteria bacterium]|nr:hypothetical protein [Deltaproteobacteria bacterium]